MKDLQFAIRECRIKIKDLIEKKDENWEDFVDNSTKTMEKLIRSKNKFLPKTI